MSIRGVKKNSGGVHTFVQVILHKSCSSCTWMLNMLFLLFQIFVEISKKKLKNIKPSISQNLKM